ncbi:MAG: phosphatidylglycerophosphatase A [Nitrospirae bacterium]|nr:phosphatidylglycerophosphatase A [Nitrospirota bacterium]
MVIFQRQLIIKFLSSGFFAGYFPVAPGTIGSLAGILACFLLRDVPFSTYVIIVILILIAGIYIAGEAEKIYQAKDCPHIVIDEIAGIFFTFIYIPKDLGFLLAGFLAFRFFDILKPYPIRMIDEKIEGGWGIMFDDVLAGIYANLLIRLIGWGTGWL